MTIHSYNHQTICADISRIFRPRTIAETQDAILYSAGRKERIRSVGALHSANSQICSDGNVMTTEHLRAIIGLEDFHGDQTVLVEAGVTLGQLVDWLHDHGKALGFGFPNYRGVTIAGAVATGAHGSSWVQDGVISSLVREMVVIGADGALTAYNHVETPADLWKGLTVSLGALGMIVRVRLKVVDQFNVEFTTSFVDEEVMFPPNGAINWPERGEYDQYVWFPTPRMIMRICGRTSSDPPTGEVRNGLLVEGMSALSFEFHRWMLHYGRRSRLIDGLNERYRYANFKKSPPFAIKDARGRWQPATRVVGPSHRVLISDLSKQERYYRFADWEVALPIECAAAAIQLTSQHIRTHGLAVPLFGVVLRFVPIRDHTLIGHTVAQGVFRSADVALILEFLAYEPEELDADARRALDEPWIALVKTLISQFGARPHWGKNQDWVFEFAMDQQVYGENRERFRTQLQRLDPNAVFSNAFIDRMFGPRQPFAG